MSELLSVADLEAAKKQDTFHSEVITGKAGGVAGGADIDFSTNQVTGQVQLTLPNLLNRLGVVYAGDFLDGFTLYYPNQAGYDGVDLWSYNGVIPSSGLVVDPGTLPSTPNWKKITFESAYNVNWQGGNTVGYSLDDNEGFKQALLADSGIIDDGFPDTLADSQRLDAMKILAGKYAHTQPERNVGFTHIASAISYISSAVGSVIASLQQKFGWGAISVFDFMTDAQRASVMAGDLIEDVTVPMQKARDFLATSALKNKLEFPAGAYKYTVSPNWAIQDAEIVALGDVVLRCTGTGNCVILDAGSGAQVCYNVTMSGFTVEGASTTMNGVYIRSIHHSNLNFRVLTCGATYVGILVEFAVLTVFDRPAVTGNILPRFTGTLPAKGMRLTRRNANEQVSYCTIICPIMEVLPIGLETDWTLGNLILGGALEACSNRGLNTTTNSLRDAYHKIDFESNTTDIVCSGRQTTIVDCDTTQRVVIDGSFNTLRGGAHETVEVSASAGNGNHTLESFIYRRNDTGSLIDNGIATCMRDLIKVDSGGLTFTRHNSIPRRLAITVTASPFIYKNITGNDMTIAVSSGTVSQILLRRDNIATAILDGTTNGSYLLSPKDQIEITYTVAPNVVAATR